MAYSATTQSDLSLPGIALGDVLPWAIAEALFPTINEVPEHFSAVLLWKFRVASLGIQVVLWTTPGLSFGWLAERKLLQSRSTDNARLKG